MLSWFEVTSGNFVIYWNPGKMNYRRWVLHIDIKKLENKGIKVS